MEALSDFWTFLTVTVKLVNFGLWSVGVFTVYRWVADRVTATEAEPVDHLDAADFFG